jgi:hypothetical protein
MEPLVIALEPAGVEIPAGVADLASFRHWLRSPEFPERGRIDWLPGRMEVDMAPEDLETHGAPKSTIAVRLGALLQERRLGRVYIDRARLTCPGSELAVEPDVLVLLLETVRAGRVRLVPRASGEGGRYLEVEGTADLVVEVVSDSSEQKDTVRLRALYHAAGVREYWIVDARRDPPALDVLLHRPDRYEESPVTGEGFRRSAILGAEVRLVRECEEAGLVFYRLDVR